MPRAGIITPEMEYVAIRENLGREIQGELARERIAAGESFGARDPRACDPRNSCADEIARGPRDHPPTTSTIRKPSR